MASNAASAFGQSQPQLSVCVRPPDQIFLGMTKSKQLVFQKKGRGRLPSPAVVLAIYGIFVYSSVVFWIEARFARSPSREVA